MKHQITKIFTVAVLLSSSVHAQWSLTGNSGTTSSNFLGTTDANDLRIRTNNSTRITVKSSGTVGIGITPDSYNKLYSYLSVSGTIIQDQVYAATRGRIASTSTRANGYLGAFNSATLSVGGFPPSINYMGVLGVKENASDFGAGVLGWNRNTNGGGNHYGVYGLCNGDHNGISNLDDKNIGVYGNASGNITNIAIYGYAPGSDNYGGYFSGRGYFSDKVGIGVESPSSMLTLDAPASTALMSLRASGVTKLYLNSTGFLGIGTTTQTSALEVNAPASASPLKLAINGSTKFYVHTNGRIGIGSTNPTANLHVKTSNINKAGLFSNDGATSSALYGLDVSATNLSTGTSIGIYSSAQGTGSNNYALKVSAQSGTNNYGLYADAAAGNTGSAYGLFASVSGGSASTPVYAVYGTASGSANYWAGYFNGTTYTSSLRVGTTNGASGYIVSVGGKMICEEVKVALEANWPDYVFKPGYKLLSLEDLKHHIQTENHLPGIPSATEVENNKGYELGQMQQKLLEKIEELTLYVIQLNDENKKLQQQIDELKK